MIQAKDFINIFDEDSMMISFQNQALLLFWYIWMISEAVLSHPAYAGEDIVIKSKKYPQFLQELMKAESGYFDSLNMALYSSLEEVQIHEVLKVVEGDQLYLLFFAHLLPPGEDLFTRLYLLWIRLLDQPLRDRIGQKYTVVYFHSFCQDGEAYQFLCQTYRRLPLFYLAMLDTLYTVETSYFIRKSAGLFQFGRLNKLFQRKLVHLDKLSDLAGVPRLLPLLQHLPEKLQEKSKKKLLKHNPMAYHQSLPVQLPKRQFLQSNIHAYKLDSTGIPVPLAILLRTMRENENFLKMEGIFRKSGSIDQQQQIMDQLKIMQQNDTFKNAQQFSGYAFAGVIKKFFTKLNPPIVPYTSYNKLLTMAMQNSLKGDMALYQQLLNGLSQISKQVLLRVLFFIGEQVVSKQQVNKMSLYNISVCFYPCIFRSETLSQNDLIFSPKFIAFLNGLIQSLPNICLKLGKNVDYGKKGSFGVA